MNFVNNFKLNTYNSILLLIILMCTNTIRVVAQNNELSTDELYTKARKTAFDKDDYKEAIKLIKKAINKSPDYLELSVFLGRLYTFTDSLDYARTAFKSVLKKEEGHEDASLAYGNLEYWNDDSKTALEIVNNGLLKHPKSENLLLLKAKLLKDLKNYKKAKETIDSLLDINPKLTKARAISEQIRLLSSKNNIGLSYDFVYFDKRFDDPWHLASIDYGRTTSIGSLIGRINYANRFRTNATQFEIDAYPSLSKIFYAYLNAGISNDEGIFPKYRAGFSLYANLPAAFEADGGFRYLGFSGDTWIYTFSLGKYYKSYWFNLRTYLTPSNAAISHSYTLTVRYYLGGANNFLSLNIGTGLSPDDASNSVLFNSQNTYRLKSSDIGIGYRTTFKKTNIFFTQAAIEDQEYARDSRGYQISVGVGYIKNF